MKRKDLKNIIKRTLKEIQLNENEEKNQLNERYTCWHRTGTRSSGKHSCGRGRCGQGGHADAGNEYGTRFECMGSYGPGGGGNDGTTKGGRTSTTTGSGGNDMSMSYDNNPISEKKILNEWPWTKGCWIECEPCDLGTMAWIYPCKAGCPGQVATSGGAVAEKKEKKGKKGKLKCTANNKKAKDAFLNKLYPTRAKVLKEQRLIKIINKLIK